MTEGERIASLTGHQAGCGISGLAVSPLGLWSASFDCSVSSLPHPPSFDILCQVRLWRGGEEGEYTCIAVLSGHKHPIRSLAVDSARCLLIIIIDGITLQAGQWGLPRVCDDLGDGGYQGGACYTGEKSKEPP